MTIMRPVWLTDTVTADIARSIRYTLLWGLEGVVLRRVGRDDRVPDVNEAMLKSRLRAADLTIEAIEPGLFESSPSDRAIWLNDIERLDEAGAFCGRIGCRRVLGGGLPGGEAAAAGVALRRAACRLEGREVSLCVRNAGEGRNTASDLNELLQHVDGAGIEACWDPAHALVTTGEPPLRGAEILSGRIGLVVVRDVTREGGRWTTCPLGSGDVGWGGVLARLAGGGYGGPLSLEFEGARPEQALRDATTLIRLIRAVPSAC